MLVRFDKKTVEDILKDYKDVVNVRYAAGLVEEYPYVVRPLTRFGLTTYKTRYWVREAARDIIEKKKRNEKNKEVFDYLGVPYIEE